MFRDATDGERCEILGGVHAGLRVMKLEETEATGPSNAVILSGERKGEPVRVWRFATVRVLGDDDE